MNVLEAIQSRRSIKNFTDEPVGRPELELIIAAGALAPNHKMTQPWRFIVAGPETRRAYGRVLGLRKAAKLPDPTAADAVVAKQAEEHAALPAMIVVAMTLAEDPAVREEDFAACWMAVDHMCLAALELGLGTHVKTGAAMDDPRAREALHVPDGERVVAIVRVGRAAEQPTPKPRTPAPELTRWLP